MSKTLPPGFGAKDTEEQTALRAEAKELGISIRGRPKAERMREIIEEELAKRANPTPPVDPQPVVQHEPVERALSDHDVAQGDAPIHIMPGEKLYLTEAEYQAKYFQDRKKGLGRLIRCRITNMNPNKKDWTGEIISVGSAAVGTYKKFIPYNLDEPYHIPWIIFQHMKERECAIRHTQKGPGGRDVVITKMIKEFALEELPPLSREELDDMRKRQAMARGAA